MSDFFDKVHKWEELPVSTILQLMVKWFEFESVDMECRGRYAVESGTWFKIKASKDGKEFYVEGQRMDILKRRLIEQLDRMGIRGESLEK